tara:strand:- start:127 stop:519 length:393 start_codon:yes stop_codon:yes gene_type:complete
MKVQVYRNLKHGKGRHSHYWSIKHRGKVINKDYPTQSVVLQNVSVRLWLKTVEKIRETGVKTPAAFLEGDLLAHSGVVRWTESDQPPGTERITFNPKYLSSFVWESDEQPVEGVLDKVWFTKEGVFSHRV